MVESQRRVRLKYILAIFWLLFTVSFAIWWMYFGLKLLNQLADLVPQSPSDFERQRRMLLWEGSAWLVLLFAGGATLTHLVAREARRARELKEFFAAFSHDVKTSLASLRLQAESLKEDFAGHSNPLFDRLVADTVRLHLQLQNSLFLASHEDLKLYIEKLDLKKLLGGLGHQWPTLKINLNRNATIEGDERAWQSILANIAHNAVVHGGATELKISVEPTANNRLVIHFADNGRGFSGDVGRLGQLFYRHNSSSGSGVGLYISRQLMKRMGGSLDLKTDANGFQGSIESAGTAR